MARSAAGSRAVAATRRAGSRPCSPTPSCRRPSRVRRSIACAKPPPRGFVGAFGLAAGEASTLSDEGREALADLAKLAAAQPQEDGDEEDEEALVEIEEFVRVAALLLHGDCVLARQHRQRLN